MKKLNFLAVLIFTLLLFSANIYSDTPVDEYNLDFKSFTVLLDPSPDERVVGHRLYYYNIANESDLFNKDLPLGTNEATFNLGHNLPESNLPPNSSWVFKATAYDAHENESDFSNSVTVNISGNKLPNESSPGKWLPINPPNLIIELRIVQ